MTYVALLENDNDIVIRGDRCVTSLAELYQVLLYKDTTEIQLTKEFSDKYFTPSGLADFIYNAQTVNPYVAIKVADDVVDFRSKAIDALASANSVEELIYMMEASPKEFMETVKMLCKFYTDAYSETLQANNKVSSLQLHNSQLQHKLNDAKEDYDILMRQKNDIETKLKTLIGRINYSYEKDIDPSKLLQLKSNKFTKILYIKERTRIRFLDTWLYYFQEILKTLYSVPARLVVIEPYYANGAYKLYPNLKPHHNLTYRDVYQSDILMCGFQPRIMEDILQNASNVEYLIVLDRGQFREPHILGPGVEYIYTMSNLEDNYDGIDQSRIISYSHSTLHIPYIRDYENLSLEDRMIKYSSMDITKSLLDLIELR